MDFYRVPLEKTRRVNPLFAEWGGHWATKHRALDWAPMLPRGWQSGRRSPSSAMAFTLGRSFCLAA